MTISQQLDRFSEIATPSSDVHARLPLVSVIIVNYNYGRFLDRTVGSVYGQTYSNVECILVDNASTDETPEVLPTLQERYPQLIVIRRATNDGQSAASLDGLAVSHGPYVIFVDADDFLLPRAVDIHILAHLSMRRHVGFTCGDMLQVYDDQVVVSTGAAANGYIRSRKGQRAAPARLYHHPYGNWPDPALVKLVDGHLHYAPPLHSSWIWSPTSGNCYRRDALLLFSSPELATLRASTDLYYAHGIGGFCGSVLIDEPVFGYRIHGDNIFTKTAQLDNVPAYGVAGHNYNQDAQFMLLDHMVANVARFAPTSQLRLDLVRLLRHLDIGDNTAGLPRWARKSRVASAMVKNYPEVARVFGPTVAKLVMVVVFGVPITLAMKLGR